MQDAYYPSGDWGLGPCEAMLVLIEIHVDVVFEVDESIVEGLRK